MSMPGDISGVLAAFVAGLVTSLHCVGMCGPLACAACASPCSSASNRAAGFYHVTRITSYAVIGLVAGWFGERLSNALLGGVTRSMSWVFVFFFLAVVIGLDKRIRLPNLGIGFAKLARRSDNSGPLARGAILGTLTPLLPCAPLYLVVAASALSGSAESGALLMAAFGLGTAPLLFVVQNRLSAIEKRWSPRAMDYTRRGLALVSVALLVARGTYEASTGCLMCH